jgi:hypothetical protein
MNYEDVVQHRFEAGPLLPQAAAFLAMAGQDRIATPGRDARRSLRKRERCVVAASC